jgi:hypothetical protein
VVPLRREWSTGQPRCDQLGDGSRVVPVIGGAGT